MNELTKKIGVKFGYMYLRATSSIYTFWSFWSISSTNKEEEEIPLNSVSFPVENVA